MTASHPLGLWLRVASSRALLLGFGWWALSDGRASSVAVGVPVVAVATVASVVANRPRPLTLRLRALVHLAATFLVDSVRGGWDVARLALAPRRPLHPVVFRYDSALSGAARRLFTSLSTLVPGTLTAEVGARDLRIHALVDGGDEMRRELATLERRVARAFGVRLDDAEAAHA